MEEQTEPILYPQPEDFGTETQRNEIARLTAKNPLFKNKFEAYRLIYPTDKEKTAFHITKAILHDLEEAPDYEPESQEGDLASLIESIINN